MVVCSRVFGCCVPLCVFLVLGCGNTPTPPPLEQTLESGKLQSIYDCYKLYSEQNNGKWARSLADLKPLETGFDIGCYAVQTGEIVVAGWGKPLGQPDAIFAYEKAVPLTEGLVILGDGKVKKMTAAEFKAAGGVPAK